MLIKYLWLNIYLKREHLQKRKDKNTIEQGLLDIMSKKGNSIKYYNRILASNIIIVNMTGSNTELAKNLILAGANITIVDD